MTKKLTGIESKHREYPLVTHIVFEYLMSVDAYHLLVIVLVLRLPLMKSVVFDVISGVIPRVIMDMIWVSSKMDQFMIWLFSIMSQVLIWFFSKTNRVIIWLFSKMEPVLIPFFTKMDQVIS